MSEHKNIEITAQQPTIHTNAVALGCEPPDAAVWPEVRASLRTDRTIVYFAVASRLQQASITEAEILEWMLSQPAESATKRQRREC